MTTPTSLVARTFPDRAEALAHFFVRAGESPRLLALDDLLGCPMDYALPALEWTAAVGVLQDDDVVHAARLTGDSGAAVIERRDGAVRQFVYLGPRLDAPMADLFEGAVLFDEPGVKAIGFHQRVHAVAHFLRATGGDGALLAMLSRRGPEVRHLRRWFPYLLQELQEPRPLLAGWFAVSAGGALFAHPPASGDAEPTWRYIEVGLAE